MKAAWLSCLTSHFFFSKLTALILNTIHRRLNQIITLRYLCCCFVWLFNPHPFNSSWIYMTFSKPDSKIFRETGYNSHMLFFWLFSIHFATLVTVICFSFGKLSLHGVQSWWDSPSKLSVLPFPKVSKWPKGQLEFLSHGFEIWTKYHKHRENSLYHLVAVAWRSCLFSVTLVP